MYREDDDMPRHSVGFDQYGNPYGFNRGNDVYYRYDGKHYTEDELIDFADTMAHYDMQDSGELIGIRNIDEAIDFLGDDEVEIVDGSEYARGGGIPKAYTHFIVRKSDNKIINGYDYKGVDADDIKYYTKEDFNDMGISSKDFTLLTKASLMNKGINPFDEANWTNSYAEGGNVEQGNLDMLKNQVIQVEHHAKELMETLKSNPQVDAWVVAKMDRATSNLSDITHYLDGEQNSFADGGMMAKGGEVRYKLKGRNFGEQMENGQKFKELISKVYNNQSGESKYPENFIKETAFTTKIVKNKDDNTYWAKDYMYNGTLSKFTFLDDENFLKALALVDRPAIRKMVDGGVTFEDKVDAISKSLLKRKKVSPSVQKDYGKTYSKSEAIDSAKRIAGAMRKKEMSQKKS